MILELFGLPGSGKSYIIKKINDNKPIGAVSCNSLKNAIISILKRCSVYTPSSIRLRHKLDIIYKDINTTPLYIRRDARYYINNLLMVAFGYKHSGKKKIFMDEGIIHRIVGFAVNYELTIEKTIQLVEVFRAYIDLATVVYLDVPEDECFKSIKSRNRHEHDMDELDDGALRNYLTSYKQYFEKIYQQYGFMRITRNDYERIKELQ